MDVAPDTTDPRLGQPDADQLRPRPGDPARLEAFIPSPCLQNHAANLLVQPDGDILRTWFGGTQEGIPAPDGTLWLIWTAQLSGNQDTTIVRRRTSTDGGRSWGPVSTLFDTVGTSGIFVRQSPTMLDNGDVLLPTWYCHGRPGERWNGSYDTSTVRISSDGGATWMEADGTLLGLFRSRRADSIYETRSSDRGRIWSAPVPTALPNNNSSIQFTKLHNGHLALVFNDISAADSTDRRALLYDDLEDDGTGLTNPVAQPGQRTAVWGVPRAPMTLAISEDGGRTWPHKRNLDVGDGFCMTNNSREKLNREYSYPSVKQRSDGAIHIAFTHYRQAIKYARVTEDWVRQG